MSDLPTDLKLFQIYTSHNTAATCSAPRAAAPLTRGVLSSASRSEPATARSASRVQCKKRKRDPRAKLQQVKIYAYAFLPGKDHCNFSPQRSTQFFCKDFGYAKARMRTDYDLSDSSIQIGGHVNNLVIKLTTPTNAQTKQILQTRCGSLTKIGAVSLSTQKLLSRFVRSMDYDFALRFQH
jgi:hypothetical protein